MKLLNNTQSKRSILSKCGVDKQIFLSDVYKKRTQAKKHQLDAPQFGRSMVEMLGVLAIIGVLSVGGIAGYSKAMHKHKINKMIDIVSHSLVNLTTLLSNPNNSDLSDSDAIKSGVFNGLTCDTDSGRCQLPYGEIMAGGTRLNISLEGIDSRRDICIDLLSRHWENDFKDNIRYIGAVTFNGIPIPVYNNFKGIIGPGTEYDINLDYDMNDIQDVCNRACDPNNGNVCYFYISLTTAS